MYRPSLPKVHKRKIKRLQFLLQPLPGHCSCSNSDHRQKLAPIYQSLSLIMGQLLQQKYTDMAYPGKFDHKLAVKRVPFFGGRASDDFGASHYEIQTIKNGFQSFLNVCDFSV